MAVNSRCRIANHWTTHATSNNADRESEAADCIEPRAELPLPVHTNHQAGMTGKETPMSQLYGDTTGHKESAKPAGQRLDQDDSKESSKTVSRMHEDTTNVNDSTSPVKVEDSGVYVYGGQNGPEALSRLYGNSMVTGADYKETQSTMYEGGNPVIKHKTGSTANSIPGSTPQRAADNPTVFPFLLLLKRDWNRPNSSNSCGQHRECYYRRSDTQDISLENLCYQTTA
ncbi:hypothetical protein Bbelb_377470 [Branchiostoma belcheri]|nr:hypothetical protein Bbelb_377470 [Branchiostoma belcheri]